MIWGGPPNGGIFVFFFFWTGGLLKPLYKGGKEKRKFILWGLGMVVFFRSLKTKRGVFKTKQKIGKGWGETPPPPNGGFVFFSVLLNLTVGKKNPLFLLTPPKRGLEIIGTGRGAHSSRLCFSKNFQRKK